MNQWLYVMQHGFNTPEWVIEMEELLIKDLVAMQRIRNSKPPYRMYGLMNRIVE